MSDERMPALLDCSDGGFVESVDGYRALLDDLAEGVVVVDSGEIVRFANRRAEVIFGAAPGELVGRRLGDPGRLALGHSGGPVDVEELPLASALLRGRATANVAMTADLEDGTRVWLSVNAKPLFRAGDAQPYGAMVTLADITRYKETELQLSRSNTDLAQFAAVISHDLGAPLTVIQGMADIVARRAGDTLDEQTRHLLERISAAATGGRTLIRELLDYARSGSAELHLEQVDMHALAVEVVELLAPAVQERRAAVRIGRLPTVAGDPTLLRQVLQNLIGNALKFGPPEGAHVEIEAEREEDGWCFSVRDNGVGIDPADLDRIFVMMQRGNRTAEGYPGSGIGLAVCQRIVERHGGRIWAESEPGRGSTLRFTIPY